MKKVIVILLSLILFATDVYAKDVWFVLVPSIDSNGDVIKNHYDNVNKVEVDFKLAQIVNNILK